MRFTSPENSCAGCRRSSAISGWRRRPITPGRGRVTDWVAKRGGLPGETRNYVVRITGRQAEQWTSQRIRARIPKRRLMPAKAPCAQVAEAVEAQGQIVRVARLMSELAAATAPPPRDNPDDDKFDEAAWTDRERAAGLAAHAESCGAR